MVQKISVVLLKTGKKVIPRKVLFFLRKMYTRMNRSILILPEITGFSIQMDWEYWQQSMRRKTREICILQFASTGCFQDYSKTYYLPYYAG